MSEACAVANNFEFRENKLNNKKIYIFIFLFINSPFKYNNAPQRGIRVTFAEPAFATCLQYQVEAGVRRLLLN